VLVLASKRLFTRLDFQHNEGLESANCGHSVNSIQGHLPDKTFIGRIGKGFDFLGYHFSREGLRVADETIKRFIAKATRLYEQEKGNPEGFPLLGLYVLRWVRWVKGGLGADKKHPALAGCVRFTKDQSSLTPLIYHLIH
jgi:hypothetical protein